MIKKVTDPQKIVTDKEVLKELNCQGMDKDYVEFCEDYSVEHPYAKVYNDLKSDKFIQVISGLPKVRKIDGRRIEIGWIGGNGKYVAKPNLFSAFVNYNQIDVTALNDQPNGTKAGDSVSWEPQLFIGDEQVFPISENAELLSVDPVNENYLNNTLEWDYGICKRRIRIIEGRIREKWVFIEKTEDKIKIKHNQTGKIGLRLGNGIDIEGNKLDILVINNDIEVFSDDAKYPIEIGASPETFYPDDDPESTSVDGYCGMQNQTADWADLRAAAGNVSFDDGTDINWSMNSAVATDKWNRIYRPLFIFPTASLPDLCEVTAVTLSLYGVETQDFFGLDNLENFNMVIVGHTISTTTSIADGDFAKFNTVALSGIINVDAWAVAYNVFTLNAAGRATISVVSNSKFGCIDDYYDRAANDPTFSPGWQSPDSDVSMFKMHAAEEGSGYEPKLIVTYTPGDLNINVHDCTDVEEKIG